MNSFLRRFLNLRYQYETNSLLRKIIIYIGGNFILFDEYTNLGVKNMTLLPVLFGLN